MEGGEALEGEGAGEQGDLGGDGDVGEGEDDELEVADLLLEVLYEHDQVSPLGLPVDGDYVDLLVGKGGEGDGLYLDFGVLYLFFGEEGL